MEHSPGSLWVAASEQQAQGYAARLSPAGPCARSFVRNAPARNRQNWDLSEGIFARTAVPYPFQAEWPCTLAVSLAPVGLYSRVVPIAAREPFPHSLRPVAIPPSLGLADVVRCNGGKGVPIMQHGYPNGVRCPRHIGAISLKWYFSAAGKAPLLTPS